VPGGVCFEIPRYEEDTDLRVFVLLIVALLMLVPMVSFSATESETQIVMDGGVLLSADAESVISIPALGAQVSAQTIQYSTTSSTVRETVIAALDAYDKQTYRTAISIAGRRD
jgi:hypothetical protein